MNKSSRQRAEKLIRKLTLSEQIGQLCQLPANSTDAENWIREKQPGSFLHITKEQTFTLQKLALETGHGIPLLFGIDAIHGHCFDPDGTVFPTQLALSSSWNRELIKEVGRITAKETASSGIHWTFSPVLCIGRDTRWGRVDETFGEDPHLIGELAKALITGLQGEDLSAPESIMACAKHYLAYGETQGGRDSSECDVSMRKILSYFFPPFREAVKAGCASFMTAYQSIDGTPCTASPHLLKALLKKCHGYEAFVVTDWNNVGRMVTEQFVFENLAQASAAAVESGNDMIMSTPDFYEAAHTAVKQGLLSEKAVYDACLSILGIKYRCGLFEQPFPQQEITVSGTEKESFRKTALLAAQQSMVLLKNSGILPLSEEKKKIAVIGPAADDFIGQLGDWSFGPEMTHSSKIGSNHKEQTVTILQGLKTRAGDNSEIEYTAGCHITDPDKKDISSAVILAEKSDMVILVLGDTIELNGEMRDRATLDLPGAQTELAQKILETGKPVILVLQTGRPLLINKLEQNAAAVLQCWNSGIEGGNAAASVIFGDFNPCGRLSISFPKHVGQLPVYYNQIPGWHNTHYADLDADPLFPFGFGMSYTVFLFSDLKTDKLEYSQNEKISGSIRIKNTGSVKGAAVLQIYIRDMVASCTTPVKNLRHFDRIVLEAGEAKIVEFSLPPEAFSLINSSLEEITEGGEFTIYAGEDSVKCSENKMLIRIKQAGNRSVRFKTD